jgi:hypothetical protein
MIYRIYWILLSQLFIIIMTQDQIIYPLNKVKILINHLFIIYNKIYSMVSCIRLI